MFSDRVQLRRARGQKDQRHVVWDDEVGGCVPSGAIEQQDGVCALGDRARDLVEVQLHRLGISKRQRQRRARPTGRTDCSKQIGVLIALISWLRRPRSTSGPLPDDAVLLADAGLILEPDFDRFPVSNIGEMNA